MAITPSSPTSVQNSIAIQSQMQLTIKSAMIEIEADTMLTIKAGATRRCKYTGQN
jgi:hypothetical protein